MMVMDPQRFLYLYHILCQTEQLDSGLQQQIYQECTTQHTSFALWVLLCILHNRLRLLPQLVSLDATRPCIQPHQQLLA